MGELITKLGIDWKLLLANTVTFFLVLWILRKFAYRPIMDVLERRQKSIADGLASAQRSQDELKAIQRDKQQVLQEAKTAALGIVTEAKRQADTTKQQILQQAQTEASATIERTKAILDRERQDMVDRAKGELADLVVTATDRVLGATLDAKHQRRLADEAVAALDQPPRP